MTPDQVPPRPDGLHPFPPIPMPAMPDSEQRPKATWSWWEAVGVYLLSFLLIGGFATLPILRLIEDEDLATIAASAVAAIVNVGVLLAWLSTAHPSWRSPVGFPVPGRRWAEVRSGIGFGLVLYPGIVFGVGLVVSVLLRALSGETVQAPQQIPSDPTALGVVLTVVYGVVIAPIHEELFFRGVLFRGVRDRYGLGAGLLASGLGFSLIHYLDGPWQDSLLLMGVMFFNGIALAWFYERRGNLVAVTVAHMTFNVIGLSLLFTIG